jgi:hypothetical protein
MPIYAEENHAHEERVARIMDNPTHEMILCCDLLHQINVARKRRGVPPLGMGLRMIPDEEGRVSRRGAGHGVIRYHVPMGGGLLLP